MMLRSFADESIRGQSHESRGTECQDSCDAYVDPHQGFAIAVVSDGHGGRKYTRSKVGSQTAVDATKYVLLDYLKDPGRFEKAFRKDPEDFLINRVSKRILGEWFDRIDRYDAVHPPTESEMEFVNDGSWRYPENKYGATLVIAVITSFCAFAIQVGDGDIVVIGRDGKPFMPMPNDIKCDDNITSSICSPSSWSEDVRVWYSYDLPVAMTCSSDGLSTTFDTLDQFMAYIRRPTVIVAKNMDRSTMREDLRRRSRTNRCDDVSLSIICNDSEMDIFDGIVRDMEEEVRNRKFPVKHRIQLEADAIAEVTGDYREGDVVVVYPVRIISGEGVVSSEDAELVWYKDPDSVPEEEKESVRSTISRKNPSFVVNVPKYMVSGRYSFCRAVPKGIPLSDMFAGPRADIPSPASASIGLLRVLKSLHDEDMRMEIFDPTKIWADDDGTITIDSAILREGADDAIYQRLPWILGGMLSGTDPSELSSEGLKVVYPKHPEMADFLIGSIDGSIPFNMDAWFGFLFVARLIDGTAESRPGKVDSMMVKFMGMTLEFIDGTTIYMDRQDVKEDVPYLIFHHGRRGFSFSNVSDSICLVDGMAVNPGEESGDLKGAEKITLCNNEVIEIIRRPGIIFGGRGGGSNQRASFRNKGVPSGQRDGDASSQHDGSGSEGADAESPSDGRRPVRTFRIVVR